MVWYATLPLVAYLGPGPLCLQHPTLTYVYDDVTYVYDDVTYVYDDVLHTCMMM